MSQNFKHLSTEVIHHNPWWDYKKDTFERPDGTTGEYFYSENPGSGAALVIPVLPNGNLLLTRQYRYLRNRMSVGFPGGGIGKDETPVEAAKRELLEETGYVAEDLISVGAFEGSTGMIKDMAHFFLATHITKVAEPQNDVHESIEIIERRSDEFEDMIQRGEIWDGQALGGWLLARGHVIRLNNESV